MIYVCSAGETASGFLFHPGCHAAVGPGLERLVALGIFNLPARQVYAEPLDQITKLDNRRKILAIGALILFILVFTPVPLINIP